jgi:hypothetical protein
MLFSDFLTVELSGALERELFAAGVLEGKESPILFGLSPSPFLGLGTSTSMREEAFSKEGFVTRTFRPATSLSSAASV